MKARSIVIAMGMACLLGACIETREDQNTVPAGHSKLNKVEAQSQKASGPATSSDAAVEIRQRHAEDALARSAAPATVLHYGTAPQASGLPSQTYVGRENYIAYEHNPVRSVAENPLSTFSVDVDTAGYANVRRMLVNEGRLPPSSAVRTEEMINYFSYSYETPGPDETPFSITTELAPAPWAESRYLMQVGLKGFEQPRAERPPSNLVFLIDVSGSMQAPNKLGLVKKSLRVLVRQMEPEDRIALAVYAGAAGTVLESTPGDQRATILQAIDALQAGGSTHGSAGIELAYAIAEQHFIEGGINRVIIASDGDMNVGTTSIDALKDLVSRQRDRGIALTTLGFGSGNYNDALMEQLADVGNGNAAYIDSLKEAQKVLVNEMQSTLLTIANDVKIQVEFNPATVSEYRLIGYENRLLEREDFSNDKVDAGDIGAGHTVTALYELTLVGSEAERLPTLRYQADKVAARSSAPDSELAYVKLRYKRPGDASSIEVSQPVLRAALTSTLQASSHDLRFAASVAGFSELLKGGEHLENWQFDDALDLARSARGDDRLGYRSEFIHLIELAQSLSFKG
ncbi:MAG: VWA domain-containing protein [Pseudomonadota bacterium]